MSKMWEFKLKFALSLVLVLNHLDNGVEAFDYNPDLDLELNWDWMETVKLGMVQGGRWLRPSTCPAGSFVTGYKMQYGRGNATGEITGLRLDCSKLDQNYKLKSAGSLEANGALINNGNSLSIVSANKQAVGFSMARWMDFDGFEYVDGRRLAFVGEDESINKKIQSRFKFPKNSTATFFFNLKCRENWAICGVQGKQFTPYENAVGFERAAGENNESILTQLRFKCCYYCIPQERRAILDDYTNPGSTDYTRTIRKTVGTQVDIRESGAGSTTTTNDTTNELQEGNSKSLVSSQTESEGDSASQSSGQSESTGWNNAEELKISTNNQKSKELQASDSISTSQTENVSEGKSCAQIDNNHWSNTEGTSSSHNVEASLENKNSAEFNVGVAKGEVSLTATLGYSYNNAQNKEKTKGGRLTTEDRKNEEKTNTNQMETNTGVTRGASVTNSSGMDSLTSQGKSGGASLNKEESRQKSLQKAKERSMQQGAQAMFTQRQTKQESSDFRWDKSDSSMWREEREDTYSFTCEAMHRCRIEQVYGTCGALQIGTPKIVKKIELLQYDGVSSVLVPAPGNETGSTSIQETQWEINIPGETWIVAKDFSFWEPSGQWENIQVCPPDTIVTGHMFKKIVKTGFTGITLICSKKYGPDEGEREHQNVTIIRINSEDEPERNRTRGHWGLLTRGSRSIFAEGFSFARKEMRGRRWIGNQEIVYHGIELMKIPSRMAVNSSRIVTKCPEDHAICGLTAMMDKDGIGILTGLGFRCCHHCIPEEKWVEVHNFENNSPSDEKKEVRTTVGIQRTKSKEEKGSQTIGHTIDSEGISRTGLHAGFKARFGKSNSTGFDWTHTASSIWKKETMITETYTCEAFSSCKYQKLVGQCGTARVPVDKFSKISVRLEGYSTPSPAFSQPLSATITLATTATSTPTEILVTRKPIINTIEYNLEDELTPVQLKNGEIWIEAKDIQHGNSNADMIWRPSESCPWGSFVTGYKINRLGGENELTKGLVKRLELECSRWNAQGQFTHVKFIKGEQGSSRLFNPNSSPNSNKGSRENFDFNPLPAVGFHYFSYKLLDEAGQQYVPSTVGHSLVFDRWSTPTRPLFNNTEYQVNLVSKKIVCPTDYVICGLRTRNDDDTGILMDVKFRCCYHCEPSEKEEELDNRQNPTDSMITHTIPRVSVGAVVEVKNPLIEGSTPNSWTLRKGFSEYQYIKEMFSHRLPKTAKKPGPRQPKVNWKIQPKTLWTSEDKIPVVNYCKPGHNCVVSQVVGVCGVLEIPTSFTPTQYTLIGEDEDRK